MSKQLKRGDIWIIRDRLWVVVNKSGAVLVDDGRCAIFSRQRDALAYKAKTNRQYTLCGAVVVRMADNIGEVA